MDSTSSLTLAPRPGVSRRTVLTGVSALAVAGAGLWAPPALALTSPAVRTTAEWGARRVANPVTDARPTQLVIHHMATPNTADFSLAHADELARDCQRDHMARGFRDTGQHFTVTRGARILEGRHGSLSTLRGGRSYVKGAHVEGQNTGKIGIECEGTYMTVLPPQEQYRSLVHLAAYICQQYGISTDRVSGHRDHMSTSCPGDAFYPHLETLRNDIERPLAQGKVSATLLPRDGSSAYPKIRQGDSGTAVKNAQVLLTAAGHPVEQDGKFGSETLAAVKAFQSKVGTSADGVVGPKTWGALVTARATGEKLRTGSEGAQVKILQRGLNATLGEDLVIDGKFGSATTSAVKRYQSSRGLSVDGVVGPATWGALKGGR